MGVPTQVAEEHYIDRWLVYNDLAGLFQVKTKILLSHILCHDATTCRDKRKLKYIKVTVILNKTKYHNQLSFLLL